MPEDAGKVATDLDIAWGRRKFLIRGTVAYALTMWLLLAAFVLEGLSIDPGAKIVFLAIMAVACPLFGLLWAHLACDITSRCDIVRTNSLFFA